MNVQVAVLGPSGAGKSSLLDILASRQKVYTCSDLRVYWSPSQVGDITNVDSVVAYSADGATRKKCKGVGYAMQDDFLCPCETVAETLYFAARLRLLDKWTDAQIFEQVHRVLVLLKLLHIANTRVGSSATGGGISGGERKRVSIGIELVGAPNLLILDEPTSGLDSASTAIVLQVLRAVADAGCSTVFSIHQPPFKQFIQFDQIVLMSRLGQNIFTGSPRESVKYFNDIAESGDVKLPKKLVDAFSMLSHSPRGFSSNHGMCDLL